MILSKQQSISFCQINNFFLSTGEFMKVIFSQKWYMLKSIFKNSYQWIYTLESFGFKVRNKVSYIIKQTDLNVVKNGKAIDREVNYTHFSLYIFFLASPNTFKVCQNIWYKIRKWVKNFKMIDFEEWQRLQNSLVFE